MVAANQIAHRLVDSIIKNNDFKLEINGIILNSRNEHDYDYLFDLFFMDKFVQTEWRVESQA